MFVLCTFKQSDNRTAHTILAIVDYVARVHSLLPNVSQLIIRATVALSFVIVLSLTDAHTRWVYGDYRSGREKRGEGHSDYYFCDVMTNNFSCHDCFDVCCCCWLDTMLQEPQKIDSLIASSAYMIRSNSIA